MRVRPRTSKSITDLLSLCSVYEQSFYIARALKMLTNICSKLISTYKRNTLAICTLLAMSSFYHGEM